MFGGRIGFPELLLLLVIILIFFGVGKLPEIGGAIGKGMRAFRKGQSGEDEQEKKEPEKKTSDAAKGETKG